MIFLVEIGAHDGVSEFTLYTATDGYMSLPSDSPANQDYEPRLASAGSIERNMFSGGDGLSGGTTRGESTVGVGSISVINGTAYSASNTIDEWRGYALRDITIKRVLTPKTALAQAETLFVGRCDAVVSTNILDAVEIMIRDRLDDLNKPLLIAKYAGTTTSSGLGIEGESDLKDRIKQKIWGTKNNVTAVPVNVYDLLYQVSDGSVSSIAVYDGGLALTFTANYVDVSALVAASLVPGQYATCLALGILRLGGSAFGDVTADVVEGATAADRSAGQIANRVLTWLQSNYPDIAVSFSSGTVAALDTANDAECGIIVDGDETAISVIGRVLNSIGAWILPIFGNASEYELGRFSAPSGSAVASFDIDENVGGNVDLLGSGDDGKGIPAWKVVVKYDQLGIVQTGTALFGAVNQERRAYLGSEWRQEAVEDASILEQFPNAPTITVESVLTDSSAAYAEASRLLALHSERNEIIRMRLDYSDAEDCEIDSIVELRSRTGRLGLGSGIGDGRLYRVIGRTDYFDAGPTIELELWGRANG